MNIKVLNLGLSMALLATTAVYATPNTLPIKLKAPCTPANTVFAFDIDDVLLKRSEPISTTLWAYRWDLVKNIINPYLWYNIAYLLYNKSTGSAYLELFKTEAPRLAQMVEHMTLDKKPLEGMEVLVKTLHAQAYSMAIASNMSTQDFAYYKEKFPTLFGCFSYAKVVPYDAQGKLAGVKKPSLTYFQELNTELAANGLTKENFIFIDDKKKNVEASIKEGFYGIQFKNSLELQADLANLGIVASATV